MKNIKIKNEYNTYERVNDIEKIQQAMINAGFNCFYSDAKTLWEMYSDSWAAGWLSVPDDETEIVACVSSYFDVLEDCSEED